MRKPAYLCCHVHNQGPQVPQVRRRHQGAPEPGRTGLLDSVCHQVPPEAEGIPKHTMGRDHAHHAGSGRRDSRDGHRGRPQSDGKAKHGGRRGTGKNLQPAGGQPQPDWEGKIHGAPKSTSKKSAS